AGVPDTVDQLAVRHATSPCTDILLSDPDARSNGPRTAQMLIRAGLMTDLSVTILTEKPEDAAAIERLHERTFGPGRYARTAYRIREQMPHRPDLSYTARIGTLLVGSARLTAVRIRGTPALLLCALTIEPPFP